MLGNDRRPGQTVGISNGFRYNPTSSSGLRIGEFVCNCCRLQGTRTRIRGLMQPSAALLGQSHFAIEKPTIANLNFQVDKLRHTFIAAFESTPLNISLNIIPSHILVCVGMLVVAGTWLSLRSVG